MEKIAEELMAQLEVETVFSFNVAGHTIGISESTVVSWIVIGIILILSLIFTTNLKVHNISKRQAIAELCVTKLDGLISGMLGPEAKEYTAYLVTVLL